MRDTSGPLDVDAVVDDMFQDKPAEANVLRGAMMELLMRSTTEVDDDRRLFYPVPWNANSRVGAILEPSGKLVIEMTRRYGASMQMIDTLVFTGGPSAQCLWRTDVTDEDMTTVQKREGKGLSRRTMLNFPSSDTLGWFAEHIFELLEGRPDEITL